MRGCASSLSVPHACFIFQLLAAFDLQAVWGAGGDDRERLFGPPGRRIAAARYRPVNLPLDCGTPPRHHSRLRGARSPVLRSGACTLLVIDRAIAQRRGWARHRQHFHSAFCGLVPPARAHHRLSCRARLAGAWLRGWLADWELGHARTNRHAHLAVARGWHWPGRLRSVADLSGTHVRFGSNRPSSGEPCLFERTASALSVCLLPLLFLKAPPASAPSLSAASIKTSFWGVCGSEASDPPTLPDRF
jgi:hypothetical protein